MTGFLWGIELFWGLLYCTDVDFVILIEVPTKFSQKMPIFIKKLSYFELFSLAFKIFVMFFAKLQLF
jgi:hypothetical protein